MKHYAYLNARDAFVNLIDSVLNYGDNITVRGMPTKELTSMLITILKPEQRCILLKHRNDDIIAKCAEFLWMFNGQDDIASLSKYLPRAADYSDNGHTWRGAYGPRMRHWAGDTEMIDQVKYVIDLLCRDPESRQAVISIWDPFIDTRPGKDIPCNISMQFMIRDGMLHMNLFQRSCDLMWGYSSVDVFNWCTLLELIAFWVNVRVGTFNHFIGSLHIYEKHWERAKKIYVAAIDSRWDYKHLGLITVNPKTDFHLFGHVVDDNDLLSCYEKIVGIHNLMTGESDYGQVATVIDSLPENSDLKLAVVEYVVRKNPAFLDIVNIPPVWYEFVWDYMLDSGKDL